MQEKNILDRVPKYPGRILLTPVEGMPDTFLMTRADEPTEEGTPIDKSTLDGISKNRLTGRYYDLTASKVTLSSSGGAFNPLPITWTTTTTTGASSGEYSVEASSGSLPQRAFDGNTATAWTSNSEQTSWIQLNVPEGITVTKMKIAMAQKESWGTTTTIQGLTDGGAWVNLNTFSLPWDASLMEYTLSVPSTYRAYRLNFSIYTAASVTLYEWQISEWNSATYRYNYTLQSNISPVTWENGQRVTVKVPSNNIVGVTQNYLNGIKVNTILQPNRQYELVYNGTAFDAKGV